MILEKLKATPSNSKTYKMAFLLTLSRLVGMVLIIALKMTIAGAVTGAEKFSAMTHKVV
jgi:hypothetical protein